MALYATCAEGAFDEPSGTCSQVVYVEGEPSWIPEISREFGAEMGGAIFYALFTAWAFRTLRQRSNSAG
jgi:hypothetical protein